MLPKRWLIVLINSKAIIWMSLIRSEFVAGQCPRQCIRPATS